MTYRVVCPRCGTRFDPDRGPTLCPQCRLDALLGTRGDDAAADDDRWISTERLRWSMSDDARRIRAAMTAAYDRVCVTLEQEVERYDDELSRGPGQEAVEKPQQ